MTDPDNKLFMEDEINEALEYVLAGTIRTTAVSDDEAWYTRRRLVLRQLCLKAREALLDEADEIAEDAPKDEPPSIVVSKDNIHYVGVIEALEDLGHLAALRAAAEAEEPVSSFPQNEVHSSMVAAKWSARREFAIELLKGLGEWGD